MVYFGDHYRACIDEKNRQAVRHFYTEVFECELHTSDDVTRNIPDNIDLFIFASGHCFGVEYSSSTERSLIAEEYRLACWMEIRTDDIGGLKEKCLANGATEISDYWDRDHFYFHAPGGQVYRLIGMDEGKPAAK